MNSLRGHILTWGTTAISPILVLSVLVLGSQSTKITDSGGLPEVGAEPSALLSSALMDSSDHTLVFVADGCVLSRTRATSYIRHLQRNDSAILFVASSESDAVFAPLVRQYPDLGHRVVFIADEEFQARTGVGVVPAYVRVSALGVVNDVGMSNIGWFRSIMQPRHWVTSWSQLVSKLKDPAELGS